MNQTLVITSPEPGAVIRYTLDRREPSETSPIYINPISVTGSTVVKARTFRAGFLPSRTISEHYTLLDPDAKAFSSNLPIIVISTHGQAIQDAIEVQSGARVFPTVRGRSSFRVEPEFNAYCGVAQRGSSSAGFPKPSLSFETRDADGDDLAVSLLGMPSGSDWILYAPYTDKSLMRDALAYELAAQMGWWSARHHFVEVFVDSGGKLNASTDYYGVYVLLEKIKRGKDRVNIAGLTPQDNAFPAVTGGYIFKKDRLDAGDTGFTTTKYGNFAYVEPKEQEITSAQKAYLVGYLNAFEKGLYGSEFNKKGSTNHYSNYIDVDSFIDNHWMVESAKQIDGYRLSNFLNKDRNGLVQMMPIWDYNLSYGNANYLEGDRPEGWYYTQGDIWGTDNYPWFGRLFDDPDYKQRYIDRWYDLRKGVFRTENLLSIVDNWTRLLSEAQARDFAKWPRLGVYVWPNADADYPNTNHLGHIRYMTNYIRSRFEWIDRQWVQAPALGLPGGLIAPRTLLSLSATLGTNVTVYYTTDGSDPRASGGARAASANVYTTPIVLNGNARVVTRAYHRTNSWSAPAAATFYTELPQLIVTELMYHPEPPPTNSLFDADAFEFIELRNAGSQTLDLTGIRFVQGVSFDFTGASVMSLDPGARVVVASNPEAFKSRYGTIPNVVGPYVGTLDNAGETLALVGRYGEPILTLHYADGWFDLTDGYGFSLNLVDESKVPSDWNVSTAWNQSAAVGGTPGLAAGAPPVFGRVVVNEIQTGDDGRPDAVELFNAGNTTANITGWFLTDNRNLPKKYVFPPGSQIAAGGYLVIRESEFNANEQGFAFSELGEEVYLFSGNGVSLTGYSDGFSFAGAETGIAYGRYVVPSNGRVDHPVLLSPTFGQPNSSVRVGPVVISEIQFHPADVLANGAYWDNQEHEFIAIRNSGVAPVSLFDELYPENTWRLRGAVRFDFPTNVVLSAGSSLLLVGFDPMGNPGLLEQFRTRYGLSALGGPAILGPYSGKLDNSADDLRLSRPGAPTFGNIEGDINVPYIPVDRVSYNTIIEGMAAADGVGASWQRRNQLGYGNDPSNWFSAAPTPGQPGAIGLAPSIAVQPVPTEVTAGQSARLSVEAMGPDTLSYQWLKSGVAVAGAMQPQLILNPAPPTQEGLYRVAIFNRFGSVLSDEVRLSVNISATLVVPPVSVIVRPGDAAELSVQAFGSGALAYQWFKNGALIQGANATTLSLANLQPGPTGNATNALYTVRVSNAFGSVTSAPAAALVYSKPTFTAQPLSVTLLAGETATFYAGVSGSWPLGYRWRRNTVPVTNRYVSASENFLVLTNVQVAAAGNYTLQVTNLLKDVITSANCSLVVLADVDRDGMADLWETANGLSAANGADASLDSDGDGVINRDEYVAGTNPKDASSYLKLSLQLLESGSRLSFVGAPDRTYSLQILENAGSPSWQTLTSVGTSLVSRVVSFDDTLPQGFSRLYRVVAPRAVPDRSWLPLILSAPLSARVVSGAPVTFAVVASGTGLTFQWSRNGVPIPGAEGTTFTLAVVRPEDAGDYTVKVSILDRAVTTPPAVLSVE